MKTVRAHRSVPHQQSTRGPLMRAPLLMLTILVCLGSALGQDQLENLELTFRIIEERETGTYIGNVAAESNLGSGYTYTISSQNDNLVQLNKTTGILYTAQVIDRENVCANEITCEKQFNILAVQLSTIKTLTITLEIEDDNDNTPTFAEPRENMTLSEALAPGAVKPLPLAIDKDTGPNNGIDNYTFSPYSDSLDKFELMYGRNDDNSLALKLKLLESLDREQVDHYRLLILAKDNGQPIRTGTLTLEIIVEDDNDNKPVFKNSVVNVSVTEDIAVGKVIVALQATDKDAGKNGQVEYKLGTQQSNYIFDHFQVNKTNGELSVKSPLSYEDGNSNKIIYVVAMDKADNPQSSQATVYLTIKDVGNNPPTIQKTDLVDNLFVSERTADKTPVIYIIVSDSDTGSNGQVTCQVYNTYFGIEPVESHPNHYQIFVQHSLDRETHEEHNVTITCQDGGGLQTVETYTIRIKDENDHTPRFTSYVYYKNVTENNTIGAEILIVSAYDEDIGDNGRINYFSESPEFYIDRDTGVVHANISLDREKYSQKIFTVLAVDSSITEPLTGTATIQLNILDINDVKPQFTNPSAKYQFRVKEGLESNTYVNSVTAIDTDKDDNGRVTYGMVDAYKTGAALAVPFDVLLDGGIKTTMELDRESQSVYIFKVYARDHGIPTQTSTAEVIVTVDDVNDETPVFVFPSAENDTVTALNEVSDIPIATLSGTDRDAGINKELIYFIVDGDENQIFSLDANSGKLYIIKYVHLTADKTYSLTVSVYDKGEPVLSDKATLKVNLRYTNITTMEPSTDVNKTNVIIVVTVVVVTCLLSITIITVICLIRRKDLHKCGGNNSNKLQLPSISGKLGMKPKPASSPAVMNDRIYQNDACKNKKEVSFADSDSLTSNDFRPLTKDSKPLYANRAGPLNEMPEEAGNQYDSQPISILRTAHAFPHDASKYHDTTDNDIQLGVHHQREDSHSETSAETATSADSGKGHSLQGDNPDLRLDFISPSAYLIKDSYPQSRVHTSSPHGRPSSPRKLHPDTLPLNKTSFRDNYNSSSAHKLPQGGNTVNSLNKHNPTRNWYHSGHSGDTSAYPDSDYVSLGSNHNHSQNHINSVHRDNRDGSSYPFNGSNGRTSKSANLVPPHDSHSAYLGPSYPSAYSTYRSNSTRDEDETTTTSGSYTINHEDLDDDLRPYQVSQVV